MKFFGFRIERDNYTEQLPAISAPIRDDGATDVMAGGIFGSYVDLDGTARSEAELINRYRDMTLVADVNMAIDDIVNESIVSEEGKKTVEIILDDLQISPKLKQIVTQEFEDILRMLEFTSRSYEIFKRWYVDGRLYYFVVIDTKNPMAGIQEFRYLDPRKIKKIREVQRKKDKDVPQVTITTTKAEYYMYSDKSLASGNKSIVTETPTGVKVTKDSIVQVTSGLTDTNGKQVLSHLHQAIKPLNQLRSMEDATLIYRISRAPERRIFYVDVGALPKMKAEQYMRDLMEKFKNKVVYDSVTGEIRDDRKFTTMIEDYWFPRREGGRGTEVTQLPAGQNLGELEDVKYFQRKLYKSLNVPISRLEPETTYNVGRATEISRDEIKFSKFIDRIRKKFSELFLSALEKQLILKGIISPEDWKFIKSEIRFRYLRDNLFSELKDNEIMAERMNRLRDIEPFINRFYSNMYVRKNILKQSDELIEEIDMQIAEEVQNPQYNPPEPPGGPGQEQPA